MIAVDTSALVAVLANEPLAEQCEAVLLPSALLMSAATFTECLIVGARPEFHGRMRGLIEQLVIEIIPVSEEFAELAASAHLRWGKGRHPARLNYGDCFSYALAEFYDCPLLYVGNDFSQTDIRSALASA
ncbi:MAG: type II toxin-antitoxin system VapC family toxin [Brevundimonas sp.]|uniref:type II toxin-antitoxin system VapC family toxin n=1 Tax=Brevundimonas sp. TaxID=1871086 RepID=UPI0027346EE6|nr:type II toxin-antitoxin system VapC family toxin [Brevundimonas sp.]MDP3404678.1 type II toxin-antitoxin system VapC family toxin [Brevundimonas sp.]